jgi:hypothetical protein
MRETMAFQRQQVLNKLLPALLAFGVALPAAAACPKHAFTEPSDVKLAADSVMIATHASSNDDGRIATKLGVDEAIRYAKSRHIPVVYLQDDRPEDNYFMEDCRPDYWVFSTGEVRFDVPASHLYLVGGHLEECMSATVHDVLLNWSRKPKRKLTVTYIMDGIFSNGRYIQDSDPYIKRYRRFINIVTYNKPAGEHFQKITLLETMGLIMDEKKQYEYIERILPHYERTLPDYRVEVKLMDSVVKVLQRGRGDRPPVLRFNFVDSAVSLETAALFRTTTTEP